MKQVDIHIIDLQTINDFKTRTPLNKFRESVMVKHLFFIFFLTICISCGASTSSRRNKPFTPKKNLIIGVFSADPQNDTTFNRLKKAGFNYVHTYRNNTPEEDIDFFKLASKYDMKVMFNLRAKNYVKDSVDNWLSATMRDVNRVKDYPSLGMWYLWDEPTDEMMPNVAKLRQEIAKVSSLPTSLATEWRTGWMNTRGHSDIWMPDIYPVTWEDFPDSRLSSYTAFISSAAQRKPLGTKLIPVLQAQNFTCFPNLVSIEDMSKLRYPNLIEMRFMAFSSFTYSVHGMFFYSYYHSHLERPEGEAFFYDALMPVLNEIKLFDNAVGQPWIVNQNFSVNKHEKINLGYWARTTGDFMVLTNNSSETRDLKIDLSRESSFPSNSRKLTPWGLTSETHARLSKGILSVENVQPWETFIWKVEN